jgi:hypothetical protein
LMSVKHWVDGNSVCDVSVRARREGDGKSSIDRKRHCYANSAFPWTDPKYRLEK